MIERVKLSLNTSASYPSSFQQIPLLLKVLDRSTFETYTIFLKI
jgi:hypothetical protein